MFFFTVDSVGENAETFQEKTVDLGKRSNSRQYSRQSMILDVDFAKDKDVSIL